MSYFTFLARFTAHNGPREVLNLGNCKQRKRKSGKGKQKREMVVTTNYVDSHHVRSRITCRICILVSSIVYAQFRTLESMATGYDHFQSRFSLYFDIEDFLAAMD